MLKDLKKGQEAENELIEHLRSIGLDATLNEDFSLRYEYDVIARKNDITITFEVKNDVMSDKTGNVALEFFNSKKKEPSGLFRTTATYWVHKFNGSLYLSPVKTLLQFTSAVKPKRIVYSGGDNNADIMLYDIERFLDEVNSIDNYRSIDDFITECTSVGSAIRS